MRRWIGLAGLCGLLGCEEPPASGEGGDSGTTMVAAESTSAMMSTGAEQTTTGSADEDSSGSMPDLPDAEGGVIATASFTIPAGTVVEEFSFTSTLDVVPGLLDGRNIIVAVTDVTHPDRNQDDLCPGSHPLDGCATVDYGAFGNTHDNRISFEGADGPLSIHLYKDRSLQPEAEPLPASE